MLRILPRRALAALWRPLCRLQEQRWQGRSFRILTYHRVTGHRPGDRLCVSPARFSGHLEALAHGGAAVIPLSQAVAQQAQGAWPPRAVVITFDDGYADNRWYAYEELQRRGFAATFFVTVSWLGRSKAAPGCAGGDERDRPLSWEEVAEMADSKLVEIGSHTMTHPLLTALSPQALAGELRDSRRMLEDRLQRPVASLAYPAGNWNGAVAQAAAEAGYRAAVTVMPGRNTAAQPLFALRRTEVSADDDAFMLAAKLDGAFDLWHKLRQGLFQRRLGRGIFFH